MVIQMIKSFTFGKRRKRKTKKNGLKGNTDRTLSSVFGQCWLWHIERLRRSYCDWMRGCCAPAHPVTC
jgi:hypothetical protein